MKLNYIIAPALSVLVFFSACKKENDDVTPDTSQKTGSIEVMFANMVGDKPLTLNSETYVTHHGDSYTVSKLKYYISNIVLTKENGETFSEKESYHLIDASSASSKMFMLEGVPAGKYTNISFMIGVDSVRNVSGAQTGALDQTNGMFWTWSSGYIMAKFEGTSPQSKGPDNSIIFHVGGYKGEFSAIRNVGLEMHHGIEVGDTKQHLHIIADLNKWFHGDNHIMFGMLYDIHMPNENSKKVADNYARMFSIEDEH